MPTRAETNAYLSAHNVQEKLEQSLNQVVQDQPDNPLHAIAEHLLEPAAPTTNAIDVALLGAGDAGTTGAIIAAFEANSQFDALSQDEMQGILARDKEDAEKLAAGVQLAVDKGVLEANPPVEPTMRIDVLGKSAQVVADEIVAALGAATAEGCVMVLQGLSGTGKGTCVDLLKKKLPKAVTWSNGNVFRSLTLLAVTHCEQEGIAFDESVLTPELLARCVDCLTFDSFDGQFDTKISGFGLELMVSQVQNTTLKEPKVGKNIPTVAKWTQGEVVKFAAGAAKTMCAAGLNVLIEGREQTLNHVRTPHRFELTLSDPIIIGQRRAAQRMMGAASASLAATPDAPAAAVGAALGTALAQMAKAVTGDREALLKAAAALSGGSLGTSKSGLARVLTQLASTHPPPADVTSWLCARLQAERPVAVVEHVEPVLKGLVMKCDEFAKIHLLPTERPHPSVWNFRQTETKGLPVFGCGQCHLDGLAFVAQHLQSLGFGKTLWFNMREEPVVFLDGQACAPRTADNMNENVEHLTSIQGWELDGMEKRLRDDCAEAAKLRGGTLSVFYQTADGSNEERQLAVPLERSLPVRSAYAQHVNQQGGATQVTYHRVPIADETAPEEQDFDQLIRTLREVVTAPASEATALVFNCQMGRGRTTTGMVCGSILLLAARGWTPPADAPAAPPEPKAEGRNLQRGEFAAVLELLRLIDSAVQSDKSKSAGAAKAGRGVRAKMLADQCCDDCAHAQNMVEAIIQCTESAKTAEIGAARSPEFWQRRAINYLERYAYIVLFAAYALEEVHGGFETSFTEWSHRHWQFKRVIKHLALE